MTRMTLVDEEGFQVPRFKVGDKVDCWFGESAEVVRAVNAEVTIDTPFLTQNRPTRVSYQVKNPDGVKAWVQDNEVYGEEYSGKMFVFDVVD